MFRRALLLVTGFVSFGTGTACADEPKPRTFAGHTGAVNSVAVSPDGKLVASTGADATVNVLDLTTGKTLVQLTGASSGWSIAFSADGTKLAVGGQDNNVHILDAMTGRMVKSCAGHQNVVWAAAFAPDGKTLASASADGTVRIWDAASGKEIRQLTGPSGPWPLAYSPDGQTLAVGFDNGAVQIWDTRTWREGPTFQGAGSGIWPVAVSPDGRTVAVAQWQGGTVGLYETATGQIRDSFDGAGGGGWAVGFAGDGCSALAVGAGGVTLWDLWSGKKATIKTATVLSSVACSADGRVLVAGDANGSVHVWDIRDLRKELRAKETTLAPRKLDDHWAALADADGEKALRSVRALAAAHKQSVVLLRERIKPPMVVQTDAAEVEKLVARLDDDDFEAREKASSELEKRGPAIAPVLRGLLTKTKSAEVRRRLTMLLNQWAKAPLTAEDLRAFRAVEVLEAAGTAEARQLLKSFADNAAESVLTREAKATLARMQR